mmetsp:Transcript_10414/g.26798  ORF Transcript_10414/g.26798 Transcript_10414/m.26798 type:complete len:154 (-) Transcript_10414:362-823(-)
MLCHAQLFSQHARTGFDALSALPLFIRVAVCIPMQHQHQQFLHSHVPQLSAVCHDAQRLHAHRCTSDACDGSRHHARSGPSVTRSVPPLDCPKSSVAASLASRRANGTPGQPAAQRHPRRSDLGLALLRCNAQSLASTPRLNPAAAAARHLGA